MGNDSAREQELSQQQQQKQQSKSQQHQHHQHQQQQQQQQQSWSPGGELTIRKIASLFPSSTLKRLKSECGGVKTLLKNHHQIFVCVGDKVKLRDWRLQVDNPNEKQLKWRKTSLCWFILKVVPSGWLSACTRTEMRI